MFVLSLFVFGSSSFVLMLLKCRSGVIFHVKCYVDCAAVEIAIQPLSFILNALVYYWFCNSHWNACTGAPVLVLLVFLRRLHWNGV